MLPRALIFALALIPAVHLPSASAFSLSILYPAAAPVLQARSSIMPHVLPLKTAARLRSDRPKAMQVAMVAASTKRGALSKALNKASGALTVSVGVASGKRVSDSTSNQLRKSGISAIFADELAIETVASEQAKAKGNFPGPVPVVLQSSALSESALEVAKSKGASGAVLPSGEGVAALAGACARLGLEAVWAVGSEEEFEAARQAGASIVLVSGIQDEAAFWGKVPKDMTAIAALPSMLEGNVEIAQGQAASAGGCKAVLFIDACAGDAEDILYSAWAAAEVRSKQSKEFRITGMTGHVNGHFGTGTFEKPSGEKVWQRTSQVDSI